MRFWVEKHRYATKVPSGLDVRRKVRWEEDIHAGGIAHFISFTDTGAVEFDVWESREALETFFETRQRKALAELNLDMGEPEIHELQALMFTDIEHAKAYLGPRSPDTPTPLPEKARQAEPA